jgi:hypothetical protein
MAAIRSRKPGARPHTPSPCDAQDVYALKALAAGSASEGQQKRVLNWILNQCCGVPDNTYYPESERDSVFASGKRFVGLEIVALINMPTNKLEGKLDE